MSVLISDGLAKKYGRRQVVNNVSFEVDAGEIVGLLGPNGAGKTTSFRMTCGMVTPDRGTVTLDGKNVTTWPMHRRALEGGLGYLPQQSSVFGKLTVEQNLTATMQLLGMKASERKVETERLLEEFQITKIRNTNSARVSGGERRRLEIARCLVSKPKIIMLDEPFAGIDPVTVQSIQQIIRRLADTGIGILITDHAAREILQITGRTYVINAGEVLCSGTANEVASHPEVRAKYLGAIDSIDGLSDTSPRTTIPMSPSLSPPTSSSFQHAGQPHLPLEGLPTTNAADHPVPTEPQSVEPYPTAPSTPEGSPIRGTQVPKPNFRRRFFDQPKTIRQTEED